MCVRERERGEVGEERGGGVWERASASLYVVNKKKHGRERGGGNGEARGIGGSMGGAYCEGEGRADIMACPWEREKKN